MKHLFTAALIGLASPALAAGWYFEASVECFSEYWTVTNETGEVSPRRMRGNEIWITRTDQMNELDANGTCDFNNCRVSVTLDGRSAEAGERVSIRFSNGEKLDFVAAGGDILLSNFDTAGMGATNLFVHNVRRAEWVEIGFGVQRHRFSLAGSAAALDAIRPWMTGSKR